MSTNARAQDEFRLGPDFVARVLARADALIASRRRRRKAALVMSTATLALLAGGAMLYSIRSRDVRNVIQQPAYVASSNATSREKHAAAQLSEKDEAGAVRYLFPDASSLVRFDQSYSQMMSGIGVDDQPRPADEPQDEWL